MRRSLCSFWGVLLLATGLSACGGGASTEPGAKGGTPAGSPNEAMQRLSPRHRKSFEDWKSRLSKSCDGAEAFGKTGGELKQVGLDLGVLLGVNHHSVIVQGPRGETAILGNPSAFRGEATSNFNETVTVDNRSEQVQAELERRGFRCIVKLFGQKVHEFTLASSLEVLAYSNPTQAHLRIEAQEELESNSFPSMGLTEISNALVVQALGSYFKPDSSAAPFLASHFGLSEEQAQEVFELNSGSSLSYSVRLLGDSKALWFSPGNPEVVGSKETLQKVFSTSPQGLELEWKISIPKLGVESSESNLNQESDLGTLGMTASLEIAPVQGKPQFYAYQLKSLKYEGIQAFDTAQASQCVMARTRTLKGMRPLSLDGRILPGIDEVLSPCSALAPDLTSTLYSNGTFKKLLSTVFNKVLPSRKVNYNGWDNVLGRLALAALDEGKDLKAELDPLGQLRIVQSLAQTLVSLQQSLVGLPDLVASRASVLRMGLKWVLTGQEVTPSQSLGILKTLNHVIAPFKASTETLMEALGTSADGNDATLFFADSLDERYFQEAHRALEFARTLEYRDWEEEYFQRILQKRLPIDELQRWTRLLQKTRTELAKYPKLDRFKGRMVKATVAWMKDRADSVDQLGQVYAALSNAIDPFEDSTRQLIEGFTSSLSADQGTLDFAASLSDEYKRLAIAVRDTADAVGLQDWAKPYFSSVLQKRTPLAQWAAWNTTLQAGAQFTQREQARPKGTFEYSWDNNRKDILRKALEEGWNDQDFVSLEQIAPLASFQLICDGKKTASALASCVGLSQYSRAPLKFFDPKFKYRYGPLASQFAGYAGSLSSNQDYSLRNSLLSAFLMSSEVLWSMCGEELFRAKASTLATQVSSYRTETDTFKKWELERHIRATLENCR